MNGQIQFVDRYSALGIPRPNPETVCLGHCEGVGWWPCCDPENQQWREAHRKAHTLRAFIGHLIEARKWFDLKFAFREWRGCDGWHFVKCADCGGTGKRPSK